jgi:mRNA-degrading endonuclease RelE of RelBE toxin-antitoxin system
MDLLVEVSNNFEKELKKFSPIEQDLIARKINDYCKLFRDAPKQFYRNAYRPFNIKLLHKYESTLYVLRINEDIRVILAADEDPLFEQFIITLFHVVRRSSLDKAYKNIAKSLYKGLIRENSSDGSNKNINR